MITDLNHRRIFLEEKMRLVEENLERKCEQKSALVVENNKLIEENFVMEGEMKKLGRKLKLALFVIVLLFGLLISAKK